MAASMACPMDAIAGCNSFGCRTNLEASLMTCKCRLHKRKRRGKIYCKQYKSRYKKQTKRYLLTCSTFFPPVITARVLSASIRNMIDSRSRVILASSCSRYKVIFPLKLASMAPKKGFRPCKKMSRILRVGCSRYASTMVRLEGNTRSKCSLSMLLKIPQILIRYCQIE